MLLMPAKDRASTNGWRVNMPARLERELPANEYAAIVAHELGHIEHHHTWENLARACFFTSTSAERRREQEFEADDYARFLGCAAPLASALRRLSHHPFDLERAARLELLVLVDSMEASNV